MNTTGIPIAIKAAGMVTAVGYNFNSSCAAIRSGISPVKEVNLWDGENGQLLPGAKVDLPHWWEGLGKLAELVAPSINECLIAAKPFEQNQIPIIIGVADSVRKNRIEGIELRLLRLIEDKLDLSHHPLSKVFPRGHISGVVGLQHAMKLITEDSAHYCIVAGVDSLLDQKSMNRYLRHRRILTESNSNGFIPGEAGAAVLVGRGEIQSPHIGGELRIMGIGFASEKATIESEAPLRGDGMVAAVREAISRANISYSEIDYRISDINGEHYKFKEAAFLTTRLLHKRRGKLLEMLHPTEYTGEVRAAIGPVAFAVALHAAQKKYAMGNTILCHFGNDNEERAAIVLAWENGGTD
jgi:3-oxoacyl-[acyl-carrier-protein] synthase-1